MITPRPYQERAITAGIKALKGKSNDIIVAPTASGKSVIIAGICEELNAPTLILQPSKEILKQNYDKLVEYGVKDIAIYSDSMKSKEIDKYTYATIGSIYKKPELFRHIKYVIIDEVHGVRPNDFDKKKKGMYAQFLTDIGMPKVLGLTASPYRMVQKYFKDDDGEMYYSGYLQVLNRIHPFFFKKFCYNISIQSLYEKGYLAPVDYIIHKDTCIDVSKLPTNKSGNDYDESAMDELMSSRENVQKMVSVIVKYDHLIKHNLIVCSSKRQANLVSKDLSLLGYENETLFSQDKERDNKVAKFRAGENKRLIVVGTLLTGFDFPGLDCVTVGRPTFSLALWYQIVGRVMRIDKDNLGKRGLVLDTTNNTSRLGRVETIKMGKEDDGFRDTVETEVGVITGKALFTFKISKEETQQKIEKIL
jgi:DNA repair protein RadD